MRIQFRHKFEDIISVENLLVAWQEFLPGKRSKPDVQRFSLNLIDNILQLHDQLANKTYKHGGYQAFNISDPKPRNIHKAEVRDRLLHHAVYRRLYPFFSRTFIADSFSCQKNKGTHKAVKRFEALARKVSANNTRTCWVLKCDIKKFFASIEHHTLLKILRAYIPDQDIIWLLERVVRSFEVLPGVGLPLGNLTSQLFVNIHMNELDQYIKHTLKFKAYVRYADDFILLSVNKAELEATVPVIEEFLRNHLSLTLHPNKIIIKTWASGVDFLGWVNFPTHKILRTSTKRRMLTRITSNPTDSTLQSYLGLLKHGSSAGLRNELLNANWLSKIVCN